MTSLSSSNSLGSSNSYGNSLFSFCGKYITQYFEYIPLIILAMIFVADTELDKHAIKLSWQLLITAIAAVLFFILVWNGACRKITAVIIVSIAWIALIYIKRNWFMPV